MPERLQRKRTKGWRMPTGAIYVGRPTVWGNIWRPEDAIAYHVPKADRAAWAVEQYRQDAEQRQLIHYDLSEADAIPLTDLPARLGGLDLVCWCPLTDAAGSRVPCHADVLLELANPEAPAKP